MAPASCWQQVWRARKGARNQFYKISPESLTDRRTVSAEQILFELAASKFVSSGRSVHRIAFGTAEVVLLDRQALVLPPFSLTERPCGIS